MKRSLREYEVAYTNEVAFGNEVCCGTLRNASLHARQSLALHGGKAAASREL